ncbi:MAG: hypothetical protein GY792_30465 [Gammaproteobacteria bacterium]|nr:hypothetical protein [Gammaproteobacteria bacterium]
MTLAIGLRTNQMVLAVAFRYQPDLVLWSLIRALLIIVGGLAATAIVSSFVAGPVALLPALVGTMIGTWLAAELFIEEVRR